MDYQNYKNEKDGKKFAVYVLKIGDNAYYVGKSKEVYRRLYMHSYQIAKGLKNYYWKQQYNSIEDCSIAAVYYFDTKYEMDTFENEKIKAAIKASKEKGFTLLNYQTSNKLNEQSEDVKIFIKNYYNEKNK